MKNLIILFVVCFCGYLYSLPGDMPQAQLPLVKDKRVVQNNVSVGGACAQEKCLVIYVAPWCPSCKALTPTINSLARQLKREGIKTSIVIGNDSKKNIYAYAKNYEMPILTDTDSAFYRAVDIKGVPYFAVSNGSGKLISDYSGGYQDVAKMRSLLDI